MPTQTFDSICHGSAQRSISREAVINYVSNEASEMLRCTLHGGYTKRALAHQPALFLFLVAWYRYLWRSKGGLALLLYCQLLGLRRLLVHLG
jgi:hypothetical protein